MWAQNILKELNHQKVCATHEMDSVSICKICRTDISMTLSVSDTES